MYISYYLINFYQFINQILILFKFKEEGDVYDYVREDEYEKLVEERRKKDDFVIDDGNYILIIFNFFQFSN